MNDSKPVTTVRHSLSFWFIVPIVLVGMYLLGAILRPVNAVSQMQYLQWTGTKSLTFVILGVAFVFAFFTLVLHINVFTMLADLRRFEHPSGAENLARGFMLLGVLAIAAQIAAWPGTTSWMPYLYEVLTKGPLALALAIVVTILCSWFLGIGSIDKFALYVKNPHNNQIVYVIMGLVNLAVFVAMR